MNNIQNIVAGMAKRYSSLKKAREMASIYAAEATNDKDKFLWSQVAYELETAEMEKEGQYRFPDGGPCDKCKGRYTFQNFCGAYVCDDCDDHKGLARCYCGWGLAPGERLDDDVEY